MAASPNVLTTFRFTKPGTSPPVYIAGTFTSPQWTLRQMSFKRNMPSKSTDQPEYEFFSTFYNVPSGKHEYKFQIGTGDCWTVDEEKETSVDDAGNINNVITIAAIEDKALVKAQSSLDTTGSRVLPTPPLTPATIVFAADKSPSLVDAGTGSTPPPTPAPLLPDLKKQPAPSSEPETVPLPETPQSKTAVFPSPQQHGFGDSQPTSSRPSSSQSEKSSPGQDTAPTATEVADTIGKFNGSPKSREELLDDALEAIIEYKAARSALKESKESLPDAESKSESEYSESSSHVFENTGQLEILDAEPDIKRRRPSEKSLESTEINTHQHVTEMSAERSEKHVIIGNGRTSQSLLQDNSHPNEPDSTKTQDSNDSKACTPDIQVEQPRELVGENCRDSKAHPATIHDDDSSSSGDALKPCSEENPSHDEKSVDDHESSDEDQKPVIAMEHGNPQPSQSSKTVTSTNDESPLHSPSPTSPNPSPDTDKTITDNPPSSAQSIASPTPEPTTPNIPTTPDPSTASTASTTTTTPNISSISPVHALQQIFHSFFEEWFFYPLLNLVEKLWSYC